jgi:hypothetical protein
MANLIKNYNSFIMLKFNKLSRAEMKMVIGGDHPVCQEGETEFSCTGSGLCGSSTGSVCGTTASEAQRLLIGTYVTQGVWGDCYNTVTCS